MISIYGELEHFLRHRRTTKFYSNNWKNQLISKYFDDGHVLVQREEVYYKNKLIWLCFVHGMLSYPEIKNILEDIVLNLNPEYHIPIRGPLSHKNFHVDSFCYNLHLTSDSSVLSFSGTETINYSDKKYIYTGRISGGYI
jgi:hypothetical protein